MSSTINPNIVHRFYAMMTFGYIFTVSNISFMFFIELLHSGNNHFQTPGLLLLILAIVLICIYGKSRKRTKSMGPKADDFNAVTLVTVCNLIFHAVLPLTVRFVKLPLSEYIPLFLIAFLFQLGFCAQLYFVKPTPLDASKVEG